MFKKLITSGIALAAFALPATASATNDPQLTDAGALLATGTAIVGTNVGETIITSSSGATVMSCTTTTMTATLLKNSGSTIQGEIPSTKAIFQGTGAKHAHNNLPECTAAFGNAYMTMNTALCIRSDTTMVTDGFKMTGGACGTEGKIRFNIGSTTAGACTYESPGAFQGTYTTGGAEAQLTIPPVGTTSVATLVSGGFLCPGLTVRLGMTVALETANGSKLTIS